MLSPARRRQCVDHLQAELGISERRACAVAGQHRSTQRKRPRGRDDEEALTAAIIRLASQYGRYGYRRITALLRTEGWHVNAKRVQRIWRREGLKVPQKQPKRGRLWLNDGSCIRLRPCWPNHVWSYDFVMDRTHDGRKFRMLTVIDAVYQAVHGRCRRAKIELGQCTPLSDRALRPTWPAGSYPCIAPGSLDTSLSHAAGLSDIAVCHA